MVVVTAGDGLSRLWAAIPLSYWTKADHDELQEVSVEAEDLDEASLVAYDKRKAEARPEYNLGDLQYCS